MDERAQIQELFEACVELNASEREQYLIKHCPDDTMRARIQKMLRVHDDTDGGFSKPASEKFRDLLDAPGKQIGDFEIIREAGHGGMSTVFLARDTVLNREVALKVLGADRSLSEVARQRFLHEARAAAGLSHTNIIKIYRYGETDSHGFIAMEYVPGGTLADWISQQDRTTTHGRRKIVEVIASLADGLEHAHQRGVIHRDVKPNNVMIAQDDHPLLGDFGIARIIDTETPTETLAGAGTASYMSPEQIRAKRAAIDHRSDIFSLGIVLYESLGGRLPFTGSSIEDIKNAILFSPAARLRSVTSSLPRDLDVICSKALEKRPADRYPTAGHLAADLRAWLNGEPILARPPSIGRRLGWWARQHQRHALVGTVFLFALLLIITTLVIKAQHNATRAWVKVESKEPVSLLFARHDSATNQIDHSSLTRVENNGSWIRLVPGQYRLTAISNHDEAFCEFNLVLIDVGKAESLSVNVVRSPEEVRYEPKQVTGVLAHPIDVMEGMIQVSAGIYDQIPSSPSSSHTRSSSVVDTFLIDRTEVSFGDYCTFLDETGFPPSLYWTHFRQLRLPLPSGRSSIMILPPSEDDLYVRINGSSSGTASCIRIHKNAPVFGVTQKDAEAYARWCGKRLPTLAEWHAAARGPYGRLYPTGDTPPDLGDTPVDMSNPVESYLQVVREVNTPALWDPADGIWHTHSNVTELLATVNLQDRDVYMAGRHWSSPASTTLAEVRTSPMSMPNIRAGFRCAKSIRNSFITKNGE